VPLESSVLRGFVHQWCPARIEAIRHVLHADDVRGSGGGMRIAVRRLRQHAQLRILHGTGDLRRRRHPERLRDHDDEYVHHDDEHVNEHNHVHDGRDVRRF
jgi:hypothetical protein